MKILVPGATGFVGRALCNRLIKAGHTVIGLSRNPALAKQSFFGSIEFYPWDSALSPPPVEAYSGVEAIISLMGESIATPRWTQEIKIKIRDTRILGTRHLLKGLENAGLTHKPLFLAASAVGIYGNRGNEILTEGTETLATGIDTGFLSTVCRDWENEIFSKPQLFGRVCALRLGAVLGETGGLLHKISPLFKRGLGGPLGSGKQWMSWIHLEDLVSIFMFLLTEKCSAQGIFNAVAPNPVTNSEFTKILATRFHKPALLRIPKLAIKITLGEAASLALWSQRAIPQNLLQEGFIFEWPNLEKAIFSLRI